ncbi:Chaperonin CPN60-2 [Phytophthora citrophthora]|uniref:Chaperonin CPN60-2 n=1 Tax=Phytophthora citrophthora TaxID=4793 RepID=A0AAD9GR20_9STRA|nr:Chaperonin CPN60-2 [Phytophthora citrophthora]
MNSTRFSPAGRRMTVERSVDFMDMFENTGVRSVASSTTSVLTRTISSESCKSVAAGMNPTDLRRGIQMAVDHVVDGLQKLSMDVASKDEVARVATILANSETEIGNLISEAMEHVGKEGVIMVQDGKTLYNELDVVEGMKIDHGFISSYIVTDNKTPSCEMENPYILLVEKKVSSLRSIIPMLEIVAKQQRPLLIIAEDVESETLAALVTNKIRGVVKVCAVKVPGFGDSRKANLQDMAVLTGATVISEGLGHRLETATPEMLGSAKKVTVTKDDTLMLDGAGAAEAVEEHGNLLRASIEATTSEYEKEKIRERLAKMSAGVAVIKVGGVSEVEVGEKKGRIVNALNATRAAMAEGIVPGGGAALLWASRSLNTLYDSCANLDQKVGVEIVEHACHAPATQIAKNAGHEGVAVVDNLMENDSPELGFNAQAGEYVNLVDTGIIDPTQVVRMGLMDAFSVASLMMTADHPEEPGAAALPMGGMGGMM